MEAVRGHHLGIEASILGKITLETKIYRIFPRERFIQLFEEDRNALVLPTMWEDPFETPEPRPFSRTLGYFTLSMKGAPNGTTATEIHRRL
jgi:hypothetical protein